MIFIYTQPSAIGRFFVMFPWYHSDLKKLPNHVYFSPKITVMLENPNVDNQVMFILILKSLECAENLKCTHVSDKSQLMVHLIEHC